MEAELQNKLIFEDAENIFDSALIIGHYQHEMRGGFSTRTMFQGWLSELNIWDRELAKEDIEKLNECKIFHKGNLLKWEKEHFKLQNLNFENVENLTNFCNKKEFYIFPEKVELARASAHCKSFGGQVAAPSDQEENETR